MMVLYITMDALQQHIQSYGDATQALNSYKNMKDKDFMDDWFNKQADIQKKLDVVAKAGEQTFAGIEGAKALKKAGQYLAGKIRGQQGKKEDDGSGDAQEDDSGSGGTEASNSNNNRTGGDDDGQTDQARFADDADTAPARARLPARDLPDNAFGRTANRFQRRANQLQERFEARQATAGNTQQGAGAQAEDATDFINSRQATPLRASDGPIGSLESGPSASDPTSGGNSAPSNPADTPDTAPSGAGDAPALETPALEDATDAGLGEIGSAIGGAVAPVLDALGPIGLLAGIGISLYEAFHHNPAPPKPPQVAGVNRMRNAMVLPTYDGIQDAPASSSAF